MQKFTGYQDNSRNSFVGSGKLDAIQIATLDDSDAAMIYILADMGQLAGEDPRKRIDKQTVESDTAGSVTLKRYMQDETGTALASGVTVDIGGTTYTCGAGGVITHSLPRATYTDVQLMLDAINALPGFIATIGDATSSALLTIGSHVAVAAANIPFIGAAALGICTNDASERETVYKRIGLPTRKDRGPLQLIGLRGKITLVAGGTITIYGDEQDDYVAAGSHLVEYDQFVPAVDATLEEFIGDNVLEGATLRGPLVLVAAATAIDGADFKLKYRQALVG